VSRCVGCLSSETVQIIIVLTFLWCLEQDHENIGHKMEEEAEGWRRLYNGELHQILSG